MAAANDQKISNTLRHPCLSYGGKISQYSQGGALHLAEEWVRSLATVSQLEREGHSGHFIGDDVHVHGGETAADCDGDDV